MLNQVELILMLIASLTGRTLAIPLRQYDNPYQGRGASGRRWFLGGTRRREEQEST
jgi:hypothetical protein